MKVSVKEIDGKHRIVNNLGRIARNSKTGTPLDGGGHDDKGKAERQAGHINAAMKKREESEES